MIGRRIGRYRVLALLGRGGMATVWRAHDELLGRDVALKVLADELAESEQARRRFRHEARIAASLDHPGIVAVYDNGETDGVTYMTMALIDGETVSRRLERSLLPIDEVVRIAVGVANALGYAHERNVIHRDVTSRNIMLAKDGRVLLLDFGVALAADVSRVSTATSAIGTAAYMSPEVRLGGTADARSDLYGLGIVLYEMLTGSTPFTGERREAIDYVALHLPIPPPSARRAEVPPELDRIVERLTAREPGERHADAASLVDDLACLGRDGTAGGVTTSGRPATPPPPGRSGSPADARHLTYIVVAPVEARIESAERGLGERLTHDLADAIATVVSSTSNVRVVDGGAVGAGEREVEYARRCGAHAALATSLRVAGVQARVTWRLIDASSGARIAGGVSTGTILDPFQIEDAVVADVKRGLTDAGLSTRPVPAPHAARPGDAERLRQATRYLTRPDNEASVDGAIAILERLGAARPEDGVTQASLCRAYLAKHALTRQHEWEGRAAGAAEHARRSAPEAAETWLALGELNLDAGRLEPALEAFERACGRDAVLLEARFGVAWTRCRLGDSERAEADARAAIALAPDDWRGHHTLGKILFARGAYALAAESWTRALHLSPDNAWVAANVGGVLFRGGRIDDAIDALRRAVEIHPTANALMNLGTALFYRREYDQAAAAFESATDLAPADPVTWGNLGNARHHSPGLRHTAPVALERAVGLMRERLATSQTDADGWARLGGWLGTLGQHAEARASCERALTIAPNAPTILAEVAHTMTELGERDRAYELFRSALRHGYPIELLRQSPDLTETGRDPRLAALLAATSTHPPRPR